MSADADDLIREDIEKFQRMRGQDMDMSLPSMVELGFFSLTALVAVSWLVALFFTPDPIPGETWLGLGGLGMTMFGIPAALIYWLRRGGAATIAAFVEAYTG